MSLENELRDAMRRVPAPEGFAERVLARVSGAASSNRPAEARRSTWWRAVAATFLFAAILGGWGTHVAMERREGQLARRQVLLALRIAGTKVVQAQHEVRDHMAR